MLKTIISVGIILAIIAIAIFIVTYQHQQNHIQHTREYVLNVTPLGTSMEDVISLGNSRTFGIHHIDNDYGYAISGNPSWDFTADETIIGVKSVRGYFREITRGFLGERSQASKVTIFWGFDEDSKLIDVYIWNPFLD